MSTQQPGGSHPFLRDQMRFRVGGLDEVMELIIQPDPIMPCQFYRKGLQWEAERRLMLAILEGAIIDTLSAKPRIRECAIQWADGLTGPVWVWDVADALGIHQEAIARRMRANVVLSAPGIKNTFRSIHGEIAHRQGVNPAGRTLPRLLHPRGFGPSPTIDKPPRRRRTRTTTRTEVL